MLRPSICWGPAISSSARTGPATSGSSRSMDGWIAKAAGVTGARAWSSPGEGNDESDPASGRGWAALEEDGSLRGHIHFHLGDDSGFRATREEEAPKPEGESYPRGRGDIGGPLRSSSRTRLAGPSSRSLWPSQAGQH